MFKKIFCIILVIIVIAFTCNLVRKLILLSYFPFEQEEEIIQLDSSDYYVNLTLRNNLYYNNEDLELDKIGRFRNLLADCVEMRFKNDILLVETIGRHNQNRSLYGSQIPDNVYYKLDTLHFEVKGEEVKFIYKDRYTQLIDSSRLVWKK